MNKDDEIRCATGKICYTKKEAGTILNHAYGKKVPKRMYHCKECGTYHLTHLSYYGFKGKPR